MNTITTLAAYARADTTITAADVRPRTTFMQKA